MKLTVWVLVDPTRPGRYLLAIAKDENRPLSEASPVRWRDGRSLMDPEAYSDCCRSSFADWCARHPELTG